MSSPVGSAVRGILDDDVGAVPRQRRPGGAGRREVAHLGDREVALGEQAPHDGADLAGCTDDTDPQTVVLRCSWRKD